MNIKMTLVDYERTAGLSEQRRNFLKDYHKISNHELAAQIGELSRHERKITNEILKLLCVAMERRAYLELGYSSPFDWLTKGFGYSNASAYRRIEAARLLRSLPETSQKKMSLKIENGEVNLTALSKVQSAIKAQEKVSGRKVALKLKEEILESVTTKSVSDGATAGVRRNEEETQKMIFELLPDAKSEIYQDRKKVISDELTRHSITFTKEMSEDLKRVKEVLSHICPEGKDSDVIAYALKFLLSKKDPAKKDAVKKMTQTASAAEVKKSRLKRSRFISSSLRREILQKHAGRCSYKDPKTQRICNSTYQVQIDHIQPFALGGSNEPTNLRPLCAKHNLLEAHRIFTPKSLNL